MNFKKTLVLLQSIDCKFYIEMSNTSHNVVTNSTVNYESKFLMHLTNILISNP